MIGKLSKFSRSSELVATGLGNGELALLSMANTKYFTANPIGRRIWEHLESPKTMSEIQALIQSEYDVSVETCSADIEQFLEAMVKARLLNVVP